MHERDMKEIVELTEEGKKEADRLIGKDRSELNPLPRSTVITEYAPQMRYGWDHLEWGLLRRWAKKTEEEAKEWLKQLIDDEEWEAGQFRYKSREIRLLKKTLTVTVEDASE